MAQTLTHLNLSNCTLTELPKGISSLDEKKVIEINLEGNPLSAVERAVVGGGNARDIILMVKELKGGGAELREKKVLIVGDAAVGKTTLLNRLGGKKEGDVAAKVATDGIEIGELKLEGVLMNCWDFAGQDVYRYTHQLFLSDSSVYLVLFDLTEPIRLICSQLTYWLDSITHRASASQILLVGTHASLVPSEKIRETVQQVTKKFGEFIGGREVAVVDSLTREGVESMRDTLSKIALQNLPRVPRLFEKIRQSFEQYRQRENIQPFVEEGYLKKELERGGMLEGLTSKSWEWSLRVLNCLGSIVLVHWDSYLGDSHNRFTFVILRPSWLVDVFKTVVNMRHNFVKDGVISVEKLRRCWQDSYDMSMHDLLFEALEKFDVVCRLSGKGEGKVIVPCLLPDYAPKDFSLWIQNGASLSSSPCSSSTFRRSFLLKKEKSRLPVGVMGKVLSSMFQWGKVQHAWRTGCVVVCGGAIVIAMWEGWCGKRAGVHYVIYSNDKSSSLSSSSSSSVSSSPPSSLSSSLTRKLLQQVSHMIKNLLEDFYKVDYEAIIPCCIDSQGIPVEW